MSDHEEKRILYFNKPGPHNTDKVIHAVKARIREGNITTIVVASISGQTALRVAEELKEPSILVVCVSGFPGWGTQHGVKYPFVKKETREKLEKFNVPIIDKMPSALSGDTLDWGLARYGYMPVSWVVAETLEAVGGYGLKTAVEAALMATDSGTVPPATDVISIAGTDRGADTAIVVRTAYSSCMFSRDSAQRFQILEIIAMPRVKIWHKTISINELLIKEIEKEEASKPASNSP